MERPTCRTCPYWNANKKEGSEKGICRRHAPMCSRLKPIDEASDRYSDLPLWPDVMDWEFCGEHPRFPAYIASLGLTKYEIGDSFVAIPQKDDGPP